jgi:hypothetical protein
MRANNDRGGWLAGERQLPQPIGLVAHSTDTYCAGQTIE